MKKKLIALLLASSMALTGFVSVYGAEDFTDPGDGSAMESMTENECYEGSFSDTEDGEFTSEESGDALFSDEKELPAVQNGEVWIENAGQGMTAGISVYNSKSSFGRRKTFPQLADMGNSPGSYSLNWANPEYTSYYTDTAGNLHIVAWKNQILYDVSCNPDLNITSVTKVKLQLPLWGGFYAAPDGNFYAVTGQKNLDENDSLTVVRVLKYDRTWKLLGATDISGGYTNMFKGIYIPFDGASLRMTQIGSTLIVHTGREMYGMDGIHHQSDVTFVINTQDMTLINSDMPVNIFPFMGPAGQNYTGCQVTGFSLAGDNLITVGRSVPHSFSVNGLTGYEDLNLNAFMIITDKNSMASRFDLAYPVFSVKRCNKADRAQAYSGGK